LAEFARHGTVTIDGSELRLVGGSPPVFSGTSPLVTQADDLDAFANALVALVVRLVGGDQVVESLGVLQVESPYQHRSSVMALRTLRAAQQAGMTPELYLYMDGLHMGHVRQSPSEFENILAGITEVDRRNQDSVFLACSRCGTARGYVDRETDRGEFESTSMTPEVRICNLHRIIDRLERSSPVLMPNSSIWINPSHPPAEPPALWIMVTHPPYGSEHAFGALSLATAAMSHGIPTTLAFVEDGIWCLHGDHAIREGDRIFSIQDVVEALADERLLQVIGDAQALHARGAQMTQFQDAELLAPQALAERLWAAPHHHTRIFFF
jgi:tRNA 2-thiouridine synthesizing protein C